MVQDQHLYSLYYLRCRYTDLPVGRKCRGEGTREISPFIFRQMKWLPTSPVNVGLKITSAGQQCEVCTVIPPPPLMEKQMRLHCFNLEITSVYLLQHRPITSFKHTSPNSGKDIIRGNTNAYLWRQLSPENTCVSEDRSDRD